MRKRALALSKLLHSSALHKLCWDLRHSACVPRKRWGFTVQKPSVYFFSRVTSVKDIRRSEQLLRGVRFSCETSVKASSNASHGTIFAP